VVDGPLEATMVLCKKLSSAWLWYAKNSAQVIERYLNAERLDKQAFDTGVLRFAVEPKIDYPCKVVLDGLAAGGEVLLLEIFENMIYTSFLCCLHKPLSVGLW
jgi:hypothetical protein